MGWWSSTACCNWNYLVDCKRLEKGRLGPGFSTQDYYSSWRNGEYSLRKLIVLLMLWRVAVLIAVFFNKTDRQDIRSTSVLSLVGRWNRSFYHDYWEIWILRNPSISVFAYKQESYLLLIAYSYWIDWSWLASLETSLNSDSWSCSSALFSIMITSSVSCVGFSTTSSIDSSGTSTVSGENWMQELWQETPGKTPRPCTWDFTAT